MKGFFFYFCLTVALYITYGLTLPEIPKDVGCFTDSCYTEISFLNHAVDDQGASGIWERIYLTK